MAKKLSTDKPEQPQAPPPIMPDDPAPNGTDTTDGQSETSAFVSSGDVFDNIKSLRLRQSFDRAKIRRPLTTVGIRKPKRHEWFQSHPDHE